MSDCSCNLKVKTLNLGTKICWSAAGAAPAPNYFIFTPEEGIDSLTPLISQLRASVMNQNCSALFESQMFFQLSEDGCSWDTPLAIAVGGAFVAGNTQNTTDWYSTTTNYKRFIRFGITAAQVGGTAVAQANVSLIIDILLK